MVLDLLSIEGDGHIAPIFGKPDRRCGYQWDTFVSGPEQLIELNARFEDRLGVELPQLAQRIAVIEQPSIEKVGGQASRLGHEFAEAQDLLGQCEFDKLLSEVQNSLHLRIISLNLNGIRSAVNKGLLPWMAAQKADVVCLQEVKAHTCDLTARMLNPGRLRGHFHCAQKKGYSGVALYCAHQPDRVIEGLGLPEIDAEGRYIEAQFGNLSVISFYLPSGSTSEQRLAVKFKFLESVIPHLHRLATCGREVILCGDWNIAHRKIDLKNWRSNRKNPGFLPEERVWLSGVFDHLGFVDVFRCVDSRPEQYTWWSNRGQAWAKNVGWRIDYQIATPGIAATARRASIYKTRRFSDHAPLTIDYDHDLRGRSAR